MQFVQLSAIYREFSDPREQRMHEYENESHYHLLKMGDFFQASAPAQDRNSHKKLQAVFDNETHFQ